MANITVESCLTCLWSLRNKNCLLAWHLKVSNLLYVFWIKHLKDTKTEQKRGEQKKSEGASHRQVASVHDVTPNDHVCVFLACKWAWSGLFAYTGYTGVSGHVTLSHFKPPILK